MATQALAIVDCGPTYLLGLLHATYSHEIHISSTTTCYSLSLSEMYQISVNSVECGLCMRIQTSLFTRQVELRYVFNATT